MVVANVRNIESEVMGKITTDAVAKKLTITLDLYHSSNNVDVANLLDSITRQGSVGLIPVVMRSPESSVKPEGEKSEVSGIEDHW